MFPELASRMMQSCGIELAARLGFKSWEQGFPRLTKENQKEFERNSEQKN
jgi:hypothetical protein